MAYDEEGNVIPEPGEAAAALPTPKFFNPMGTFINDRPASEVLAERKASQVPIGLPTAEATGLRAPKPPPVIPGSGGFVSPENTRPLPFTGTPNLPVPVKESPKVASPMPLTAEEAARAEYENKVGATRFAAKEGAPGTLPPVIFTNKDMEGNPWKGSPSGGGLDTAGVDIDRIMSRFAGGGGTPGTGLPSPTGGGGIFSALLAISSAIGNAKRAQQQDAQRFHQGIEMTKLVQDALDKNREYGLKQPYYESQAGYNKAHAGLAKAQAKGMEVKPETAMMSEHAKLAGSVYNEAIKNDVEHDEALRRANSFADQYFDIPSARARRAQAGAGKPIDPATAKSILKEAGGDNNKAREIARSRGYAL